LAPDVGGGVWAAGAPEQLARIAAEIRAAGHCRVRLVVSDEHPGLQRSVRNVLVEVWWEPCYVHFLRHALDHLPRKANEDWLQELRWMYERRDLQGAWPYLTGWLEKWARKYPKLC